MGHMRAVQSNLAVLTARLGWRGQKVNITWRSPLKYKLLECVGSTQDLSNIQILDGGESTIQFTGRRIAIMDEAKPSIESRKLYSGRAAIQHLLYYT